MCRFIAFFVRIAIARGKFLRNGYQNCRTNRLRDALVTIGWALGGEAGAKHCAAHATPVCASTLLSLLRRQGVAAVPTPRVLGVDDWSFRANQAGTLLVDLEQHRPVDVLLGSDEEVLTQWLLGHAGVEVICRDRGAGYRKAATKSAPRAQQVLDRWHVLKEKSGRSDPENVSATDRRAPSSRRAGETEHSTDMPCSNWVCPS